MAWRRTISGLAFALIVLGGFQPFYVRAVVANREQMRVWLTELPFSKTPGLRNFMTGVRERTRDGDRIVIATPARAWQQGYAYAFTRSTYVLAGRTTLPLIGEDGRPLLHNLARADYIAAWHVGVRVQGFRPVWIDEHGVLLRRVP